MAQTTKHSTNQTECVNKRSTTNNSNNRKSYFFFSSTWLIWMIIQLSTCFSITLDPLHSFLFFLWDFLSLRKENNFISTFFVFSYQQHAGCLWVACYVSYWERLFISNANSWRSVNQVLENWIGKRQSDAQRKEFKQISLFEFLVSLKNFKEKGKKSNCGKQRKKEIVLNRIDLFLQWMLFWDALATG